MQRHFQKDNCCVYTFLNEYLYSRLHKVKKNPLLLIDYRSKIVEDFLKFQKHFDSFFKGELLVNWRFLVKFFTLWCVIARFHEVKSIAFWYGHRFTFKINIKIRALTWWTLREIYRQCCYILEKFQHHSRHFCLWIYYLGCNREESLRGYLGQKAPPPPPPIPTSFSSVISTKVGVRTKNFLPFSFNPFSKMV